MNQTEFVHNGIGVIPVRWMEKTPDAALLPVIDGQARWEPFKTWLPSPELLQYWFSPHTGRHNYGVVLGWQGTTVVDFDNMAEYNKWLLWAMRAGGIARYVAQNTLQVESSRGVHVYVRIPGGGTNRKAGENKNIDIKFRGYVLGPGSIHPSGKPYTLVGRSSIILPVSKLADILPPALLATVEFTELPEVKTPPTVTSILGRQTPVDPWASAWDAGEADTSAIRKIKSSLRIEKMFTSLRHSGGEFYLTRCPFHDDANPSFWINTARQICNCHTCQFPKPMDIIDLYGRIHGLNQTDAIKALARLA